MGSPLVATSENRATTVSCNKPTTLWYLETIVSYINTSDQMQLLKWMRSKTIVKNFTKTSLKEKLMSRTLKDMSTETVHRRLEMTVMNLKRRKKPTNSNYSVSLGDHDWKMHTRADTASR